uniref:Uncharacterized protein n=1 Tax=Rhizophora mucronata TaxID=61149 RepID=A0A2P2KG14_RHIMU
MSTSATLILTSANSFSLEETISMHLLKISKHHGIQIQNPRKMEIIHKRGNKASVYLCCRKDLSLTLSTTSTWF